MIKKEQVLVRMPTFLVESLKIRANRHEHSYNQEIVEIVQDALDQKERGMNMSLRGRKYSKLEIRAERKACVETDETSYVEILRASGQPSEWRSWEMKNKVMSEVKVRAQDIFNKGTWEKFLGSVGRNDEDLTSLTDDTKVLSEAYDAFLEEKHTERYRNLDADGKVWRYTVVEKAVKWHILNNKLKAFDNGDEDVFEDLRVGYYLKLTRAIKTLMGECARMNHHILKDPQLAQSELARFFNMFYEQFQSIPFDQREELMHLMGIDEEEENGESA